MAQGNRRLLSGILPEVAGEGGSPSLPPRTGILQGRNNRLAQLADGQSITRMHELVDPARCRIWDGHNRDYEMLDEVACADLIESFKAQGRQEVPAIVRRLRGDPSFDFEVICGARRHWTSSWIRANGYPSFSFLVEPRELSDEEAFRVADLENRSRRDLSDIERARDYARAVDRYYEGDQRRMAQRLQVTETWLSRFLDLAKLPDAVIMAFGSPHVLGISHSAQVSPLLRADNIRDQVLAAADQLSSEQKARKESGIALLPPSAVVDRLMAVRVRKRAAPTSMTEHVVRGGDGHIVATGKRAERGGSVTITLPTARKRSHKELVSACTQILDVLVESKGN